MKFDDRRGRWSSVAAENSRTVVQSDGCQARFKLNISLLAEQVCVKFWEPCASLRGGSARLSKRRTTPPSHAWFRRVIVMVERGLASGDLEALTRQAG